MSLIDLGRQMLDAARDGQTDQVRLLMANGAPFTSDWLGINPLHISCQNGHISTTELLLHAGISRDAKTKVDRTPLHFAAQEGHIEIADLLICSGADIESKDMLKMTPLHWAVEREHIGIIELLLMHGADIHCLNKFDKSPIDIALSNGRTDIAEMLQMTRQNVIEVTTSEVALEEEAAIAELVTAEENDTDSGIVHATVVPVATLPVAATVSNVSKPAPSYIRFTTPVNIQPRAIKKEPVIVKARLADKQSSNVAVLGHLASTSSNIIDTNSWTDANAETLSWLEANAVATDAPSIITASLESGQTLALTEAGKLALNFVRRHMPKAAATPTLDMTRSLELDEVISEQEETVIGEEVTAEDEVNEETQDDEIDSVEPPGKKLRMSELLVAGSKQDDLDLRRQLEAAQREALAYREQLQRKEREAEVYKKQLTQVTNKTTSRS